MRNYLGYLGLTVPTWSRSFGPVKPNKTVQVLLVVIVVFQIYSVKYIAYIEIVKMVSSRVSQRDLLSQVQEVWELGRGLNGVASLV